MKSTIKLVCPIDPGAFGHSQYMNMVEAIDLYLKDKKIGRVTNKQNNIDSYGDGEFKVEVDSKRHIGEVRALIKRELRKESLINCVRVVRGAE